MLLIKAHPGLKGSSPSSMNKFLLFHPLLVIISVIPVFPRRWSFFCGGHYFMVVLLSWGSLFHGVHYSMGVIISWGSLFHGPSPVIIHWWHHFMSFTEGFQSGSLSCNSLLWPAQQQWGGRCEGSFALLGFSPVTSPGCVLQHPMDAVAQIK